MESGDDDPWSTLWAAYPVILRYCRALTRHPEDAEDVASDALLYLIPRLTAIPTDQLHGAWVRKCRWVWLSHCRATRRRGGGWMSLDPWMDIPSPDTTAPVATHVDVAQGVAALPPAQARALILVAYGYTDREIAEATHVPLGTVKTRLRLARKRWKVAA